MIALVTLPPRMSYVAPLNLAILKGLISEYDVRCRDLSIEFDAELGKILYDKRRALNPASLNLGYYPEAMSHAHSSLWSQFKYRSIQYWLVIEYPFQLLECKSSDAIDERMHRLFEELADAVLKENPEVVGLSVWGGNLGTTLNVAKILSKEGTKIILGGSGVYTSYPFLLKYPFIDHFVVGEAELVFKKLINSLLKGEKVPRLIRSKRFVEMDAIPFPDYDDFDLEKYATIGTETQRGCVNRCAYCSVRFKPDGAAYRQKSISRIVKELSFLKKYEMPLYFCDNITNPSKKRIDKLAKAVTPLNMTWGAEMFPTIDWETARLLKDAGCHEVWTGCESFSDYMLKRFNRNVNVKTVVKTLKNLHNAGIKTYGMFFFRSPGERVRDVFLTALRMFKYQKYLDAVLIAYFRPTYGSDVHLHPDKYNIKVRSAEEWTAIHEIVPYQEKSSTSFLGNTVSIPTVEFLKNYFYYLGKVCVEKKSYYVGEVCVEKR